MRASVGGAVCADVSGKGLEATALRLTATTRCIRVRWDVAQLEHADLPWAHRLGGAQELHQQARRT
jgi:hypothetical protein